MERVHNPKLKIDPELKNCIPPLDKSELDGLKSDILSTKIIRVPLDVWGDIIVDGHNRYEIASRYNIPFTIKQIEFESKAHAKIWIRTNQLNRRNLSEGWRATLIFQNKEDLAAIGRQKMSEMGKMGRDIQLGGLPLNGKPPSETSHNTQETLAKQLGWSKGKTSQAEFVMENDPEEWEKVKNSEETVGGAYKKVKKKRKKQQEKEAKEKQAEILNTKSIPRMIIINQGDWWQLGRHTIFCGDTSTNEFINKVPTTSFAFADPPYNANVAAWDNNFNWSHDWLIDKAKVVAVTPGIASIFDFAKMTAMPYVWSMSCWIDNGMTRGAVGFGNWIFIAIFSNDSIYRQDQDIIRVSIGASGDRIAHKGRKPPKMIMKLLELFAENETIVDPFLGSGTTLLVAEKMGLSCFGGEISPEFCKDIILTWEALTGKEAVKLS